MKMRYFLSAVLLMTAFFSQSQVNLGTLSGVIYDVEDSTTTLSYATVWVETESGKRGAISDDRGRHKIDALKPGTYNLHVRSVGYDELTISQIVLNPNGIVKVNAYCGQDALLPPVIVFLPPIIPGEIPKIVIPIDDIEHSPYFRSPKNLLVAMSSEIQGVEGSNDIIIRGSRPGDAIYYIDGVKATDMASVPGIAIGGMEAYTGGIPAKYGDTTGGVVVLETKGYFDLYNAWKYAQ